MNLKPSGYTFETVSVETGFITTADNPEESFSVWNKNSVHEMPVFLGGVYLRNIQGAARLPYFFQASSSSCSLSSEPEIKTKKTGLL